jgi:hypothetical protein
MIVVVSITVFATGNRLAQRPSLLQDSPGALTAGDAPEIGLNQTLATNRWHQMDHLRIFLLRFVTFGS